MSDIFLSRRILKKKLAYVFSTWRVMLPIRKSINEAIEKSVTTDVAPVVHAYWKRVDKDDGGHDTVCSHCSTPIVTYLETPYCHNCGAKMDGGD